MSNVGFNTFFKKECPTVFVVKNIAPKNKTVKIFNVPIKNGQTADLFAVAEVSEADIRHALIKGEIYKKIIAGEITVVESNIDLMQFDDCQKQFLIDAGITTGLEPIGGSGGAQSLSQVLDIGNSTIGRNIIMNGGSQITGAINLNGTVTTTGLSSSSDISVAGNITVSGTVDGVDVSNHASRHQDGGADEINVAGLSGQLADAQKVSVAKNSGAIVSTRPKLNFIEGSNIVLSVLDDSINNEVDITITSTASGSGDVVGPGSATNNALARFDSTTGKLIKNSGVTLDDSNNFSGIANLTLSGNITVSGTVDGVDVSSHASRHNDGGADEISLTGLSGEAADPQKVTIRKNSGANVGSRSRINFIEGSNVIITVADDAGGNELDVTIAATGGGGGSGDVTGPSSATDRAIALFDGTTGKLIQNSLATVSSGGVLSLNPSSATAPIVLNANGQGQLVTGLNADLLDGQDGTYFTNASNLASGTLPAARFDDTSHGSRSGGSLHSVATTSVAGFMSASDKTKLDGIASGATNTPLTSSAPTDVTKASAAVGVSTEAARADHKHDISTASAVSLSVGGSNTQGSATSLARSDHTHALPAFGSSAGTFTEGNDSRLSDDRTASGLRTATTIVAISSATAPTLGQALVATSSTAATWQSVALASTTITAGAGLTGGGDLSTNRTINVVANADGSIVVNADDIQVGVLATDAQHGNRGGGSLHAVVSNSAAGFVPTVGSSGTILNSTGTAAQWSTSASLNLVTGPASATDTAIPRFNGTTGKIIQNSGVLIDGSNNITGVNNLTVGGNITVTGTVDGVDVSSHASRHQDGGADEIVVTGLSGLLADAQKVTVRKNTGSDVGTRQRLNFIEGQNMTLTIADDAGNNEVDITLATKKRLVTVEFVLAESVSNTTKYFYTWKNSSSLADVERSGATNGIQNGNNCSPYQVPFNGTIVSAVLTVKGVGVQNGSVTYPVSYQTDLFTQDFTTETKIADIDFSISNSFTVGTFSVGNTNFSGTSSLNTSVTAGQMLGLKFMNSSSASIAGHTMNAFITLLIEET